MFDEQPDGDPHGECAAEIYRLMADLAAAQRELAAYKNAYEKAIFEWRDYGYKDCKNDNQTLDWIEYRVRELLAQEGGK